MSAPEAHAPPRKRIKELEVMVADVIVETPDTATLVLFTGNDRLEYKAGHFLTIDPHQFESLARFIAFFEEVKGKKEPPRAYSLASAPDEKYLAITIKEERYTSGLTQYPPLLSPLLVKRTVRGMRLVVVGFTGPYTLPDDIESRTDHLVHVCAGSGSVPNFSILKHAIAHHPRLKHTFLYSNKTWDDVIYRKNLEALEREHTDRIKVVHHLTREEPPEFRPNLRRGRIDAAVLRAAIPDPSACIVYACGPAIGPYDRAAARARGEQAQPRFLETVLAGLAEIGVARERIKHESWG
ncbi:MAG TPA: oxidoreductase [Polyangia bacterium]|jgi:ferredoxin-NADP reductase